MKPLDILVLVALGHHRGGELVRNAQFQREGLPDCNLPVKKPNRLGGSHSQGFKHLLGCGLCRLVDSCMDYCGS
jgi:hypothetical protein